MPRTPRRRRSGTASRGLAFALTLAAAPPAVGQSDLYTYGPDVMFAFLGGDLDGGADVDLDGLPDVLAGAPLDDTLANSAGAVHVVSGMTGLRLAKLPGSTKDGGLGTSVAFVGDVDLDGVADFAAGAPYDTSAGLAASRVLVSSGADFTLHWQVWGGTGDNLGCAVAAAGDVNLDGIPDILAGAKTKVSGGVAKGRVFVLSGADGSELRTFDGDGQGEEFGFSVACVGDVNLDGWPDHLVGAPKSDSAGADAGRALVFSGATGQPMFGFWGDTAGDQLGWSVAGAGDTNGDGHPDLLIGARLDDVAGSNSGSAFLYSGASGALLHAFNGVAEGNLCGTSVAGPGDLDADGLADVLLGCPGSQSVATQTGVARAFSGSSGSLLFTCPGDAGKGFFGLCVAGLGDVDADGVADFSVSAPTYDGGGKLWVVSAADCSGITKYGIGCLGSGGFIPHLQLTGCATAGGSVGLTLSGALGGSLAVVFVGLQPASIPIKGGCTALVDPLPGELVLQLAGVGPGNGQATHVGEMPPGTAAGTSLALQALVIDPGVPSRYSTSNGVHVVLP